MKIYLVAVLSPDIKPPLEFVLVGDGVPGLPALESVSGKKAFILGNLYAHSEVAGSEERYTRMCEGFTAIELSVIQTLMRRAAQITACVINGANDFSELTLSDEEAMISQFPREIILDPTSRKLRLEDGALFKGEGEDGTEVVFAGGEKSDSLFVKVNPPTKKATNSDTK